MTKFDATAILLTFAPLISLPKLPSNPFQLLHQNDDSDRQRTSFVTLSRAATGMQDRNHARLIDLIAELTEQVSTVRLGQERLSIEMAELKALMRTKDLIEESKVWRQWAQNTMTGTTTMQKELMDRLTTLFSLSCSVGTPAAPPQMNLAAQQMAYFQQVAAMQQAQRFSAATTSSRPFLLLFWPLLLPRRLLLLQCRSCLLPSRPRLLQSSRPFQFHLRQRPLPSRPCLFQSFRPRPFLS
ncbi:hypothetical protein L596_014176 [Steinernema carpocapsae]|uniref:Uncharacterized protein n=1 Tax=Steinernema carpocapsae TaxID=34508 RepID=A0A4U5NCA1_STECR|nr:hypothetical protein L596_014176 [Steinernema carpocapsae]